VWRLRHSDGRVHLRTARRLEARGRLGRDDPAGRRAAVFAALRRRARRALRRASFKQDTPPGGVVEWAQRRAAVDADFSHEPLVAQYDRRREGALTDAQRLASITPRDRQLNSWAFRSFRDVADGDYIAGRMAHRARLSTQFLWASQQSIEKYLKCILFIRRISAKRLRHDLEPALELIEANGVDLDLTERSREFIARIDSMGRYRYMEASIFVNWHWIVSLDQVVWELRRFCGLDSNATSARLIEGKWAPRVRIVGGHLEKILRNRDDPAREPLLWQNGYFGRGRRTIMVRGGFTSENSPLFQEAALLDEILNYAYIPKDVIQAYREHAAAQSKNRSRR
jgi:hypothetical protein